MKVQSLSVVVPNKRCVNDCKFCVSKMHTEDEKDQLYGNLRFRDLYEKEYMDRLNFARDNGCNTIMLTGNSEPQQHKQFLLDFGAFNKKMDSPFRWIEMQTTGVLIDEEMLRFLKNHVGVKTISLSVSSFNNDINAEYCGMKKGLEVDIEHLCSEIKRYDFNLRLSINMTSYFQQYGHVGFFEQVKQFGADQATIRILYSSGLDTPQDKWIEDNQCSPSYIDGLNKYIKLKGKPLEKLPFGATKYSLNGISIVVDDDCMSTEVKEDYKYLILKPNCKIYSKWDDPASLLF